jgi:hypothetical protein
MCILGWNFSTPFCTSPKGGNALGPAKLEKAPPLNKHFWLAASKIDVPK